MINCPLKILTLSLLLLALCLSARAQNTKGDRPATNRESRVNKTSPTQKPAKRIKPKKGATGRQAYRSRKKSKSAERAGRPVRPVYRSIPRERTKNVYPQSRLYVNNASQTPTEKERRRAANRFSRVTAKPSAKSARNVYPQTWRFVNKTSTPERKPPKKRRVVPRSASRSFTPRRSINAWANFPRQKAKRESAYTKDVSGHRLRTRNFETKKPPIVDAPGGGALSQTPARKRVYPQTRRIAASSARRGKNIYSQSNRYVNSYARHPRKIKTVSNRSDFARYNQAQGFDKRAVKKQKVVPRSASRPFIKRKSINAWAHFPRPKRKGEKAITTDISGKPLRKKNYETERPGLIAPDGMTPYRKNKKMVDKPYRGRGGNYVSATRSGKAWRGDITNRRIRKNYTSKRKIEGTPVLTPEKRGIGMRDQGEGYSGYIKLKRSLKGGGSISERIRSNQGKALPARPPRVTGTGNYQGDLKIGRKTYNDQGEEYTGNLNARRRLKGGGSVSGKLWNNKRQPVEGRQPRQGREAGTYQGNLKAGRRIFNDQGEQYTGNIKTQRPIKGGGSVSGKLWNNKRQPVEGRQPRQGREAGTYQGNLRVTQRTFNNQGEEYTGNIKAQRPLKGGGSVSGKLWNNKRQPIEGRQPRQGREAGTYQGNLRVAKRTFNNQGEEYTGTIKAQRPLKGGGSVSGILWNNDETPLRVKTPISYQGEVSTSRLKSRYVKNNNAAATAVRIKKPEISYKPEGLIIKAKRPDYGRRKNAPEGTLAVLRPAKTSAKADEFATGMRRYKAVKNPSSANDALHIRARGKAFARVVDYQGNIKMTKFDVFGKRHLHPDAQFVRLNKNNVDEEKDMLTNFKLWWARLFKKNDTQPDHLRQKGGKPRYDKGEAGLWYD